MSTARMMRGNLLPPHHLGLLLNRERLNDQHFFSHLLIFREVGLLDGKNLFQ